MTTTPLIPNGLNSWKTTSTIVACARFAASMRELFTASRLLMDSESQSNNSRSRCRPKAFNQRPPFAFDHLPHLSCNALIGVAVTRQKKLAAAKNKVTVWSRKVDCKEKTRLDTFFDPAPAKFAARSPASHVALAATRAGWIVFVGSPRALDLSPNHPAARTAATRHATARQEAPRQPASGARPDRPARGGSGGARRDQKLPHSRCARDSSRADARPSPSRDRRDVGSIVDQLAGDTTNGSVLGSGAPTAAARTRSHRLSVT